MKSLTDSFIVEVDYLDNIVGSALAHHHLKHVIKLQEQLSTQEDVIFDLDAAKVTQYTHSCALCLLIFASALTYASPTRQNYSCMPLKMAFINASVKALAALDVYGKPDLDFILISALLLTNFLYALKPWIAAEILYHAMNVCDRLNLHKEPATSTPFDEARRNVTWFALLCASDWDLTSTLERKPIVYCDKEQFPSLFGTNEDRSRYLSKSILARLLCARLSYRTMVISCSGRRTPEEVHKLHNDILDAMAMFQSVIHASALGYEDTPNIVKARFAVAALHFLLIRLHVPDYTRAWSDKQFHISKTTCLESSVFLLHLFRDIFQVPLSCCEQGTQGPFSRIANYFQFSSRWCCVAALLLVKHFTLTLETGCDEIPSSRAAAIVQDLRILCKILHFLSPLSAMAKEGYTAMQRAAAHVLDRAEAQHANHDNAIVLWANTLLDTSSTMNASTFEPLSLLNDIMTGHSQPSDRLPMPTQTRNASISDVAQMIDKARRPRRDEIIDPPMDVTLWDHFAGLDPNALVPDTFLAPLWSSFSHDAPSSLDHVSFNDDDLERFINSMQDSIYTSS